MAALVLCDLAPPPGAALPDRIRAALLRGEAELLFLGADGAGRIAGLRFGDAAVAERFATGGAPRSCRVLRLAAPALDDLPAMFA